MGQGTGGGYSLCSQGCFCLHNSGLLELHCHLYKLGLALSYQGKGWQWGGSCD